MPRRKKILRRVCPECGGSIFREDPIHGEIYCAKCGTIIEERVIDLGQEWRAFDSEQMTRRARGGTPLTFSVDYEEPIVVKRNGKIEIIEIGKFVDEIIEDSKKVMKNGILEVAKVDDVEVLSFDEDYRACFKKIKEVSRHPISEIFEIELETGKMVKVTGNHSIFTVEANKIVPKIVHELKIGDYVVAPLKIPSTSVEEINLIEEFSKLNLKNYVRNLPNSDFIFLRVKKIEKVKPTSNYAYDLTVPGTEAFGGKIFFHNTKHDKGLTTEIGKGVGELYKVPARKRVQYYRLTKWHKRLIRSRDRNLSFALSELQRIVSFLNLSRSIHERVARYYEEAVNKGLVRGRSIESVIAALVYAVSRQLGSPRTLDEISEASGIDKREIGRTYRYVARELKIRILPASPVAYVPRFCSMLGLSDKVQAKAIEILRKASKHQVLSGRGPTGVAAAAIYIASVLVGERRTQREVADICGITEVTIRNRFKELSEKLGIEEEIEKKAKE